MKRDKNVLSDNELFEKTASIVEHAINSKITLTYKKGENYCTYKGKDSNNTKSYNINISTPPVKGIDKYTALIHELGHVMYQSPFTPMKNMLKNSEHHLLYYGIINVLEDQRIESHLGENYIAYKNRFEKTTTALGKNMSVQNNINDPLYMLLAIRFNQEKLVIDGKNFTHYKKALEDVKNTDKFGALRVFISIKKYILEVIESNSQEAEGSTFSPAIFDDVQNVRTPNESKIIESIAELNVSSSIDGESNLRKEFADPDGSSLDLQQVKKIVSDHSSSEDIAVPKMLPDDSFDELEIDKMLKEGKVLGKEQFLDIQKNMLAPDIISDNLPSNVTKIKRKKEEYIINYKVSSSLNKLFKQLKMRNKPFVDYHGYEIDIEEYVNNVIRGIDINKSFENHKKSQGASIVLSIDASSSMRGNRINIARKLVATIYESLKEIPNIEVKGNVWAGNGMGDIGITEINSMKDVGNITVADGYELTPTHMGLEYSGQMLKNMKGKKKMLILITDGMPNVYKNNIHIQTRHYNKVCKKSLQKVLQVTPNVLCVVVHSIDQDNYVKRMRDTINDPKMSKWMKKLLQPADPSSVMNQEEEFIKIFGMKRLIHVNEMDEAFFKITKQFKKFLQNNSTNFF